MKNNSIKSNSLTFPNGRVIELLSEDINRIEAKVVEVEKINKFYTTLSLIGWLSFIVYTAGAGVFSVLSITTGKFTFLVGIMMFLCIGHLMLGIAFSKEDPQLFSFSIGWGEGISKLFLEAVERAIVNSSLNRFEGLENFFTTLVDYYEQKYEATKQEGETVEEGKGLWHQLFKKSNLGKDLKTIEEECRKILQLKSEWKSNDPWTLRTLREVATFSTQWDKYILESYTQH